MKNILFLLSFLFATILSGQENRLVAGQYIEKINQTVAGNLGVKIEYTVKVINPEKNILQSDSGLLLMKGVKFCLSSFGNKIYSNGVSRWVYMMNEKEVIIQNENEITDDFANPFAFFTNYKKNFLLELKSESPKTATIILTPTDNKANFVSISVVYDKQTEMPTSIRFMDKSSTSYTINLKKTFKNQSFKDSVFEPDFSGQQGIEIIDQR